MPDYEAIKVLNDELTGNAFGVRTNLGCGTVGYSRLTLTPTFPLRRLLPRLTPESKM